MFSTEEIFEWLAGHFHPERLALAGEVDGIYTADPQVDDAARITEIRPETLAAIEAGLGRSHGIDVTGGMVAKVRQALGMAAARAGGDVVCSGLAPGAVYAAFVPTGNSSLGAGWATFAGSVPISWLITV